MKAGHLFILSFTNHSPSKNEFQGSTQSNLKLQKMIWLKVFEGLNIFIYFKLLYFMLLAYDSISV